MDAYQKGPIIGEGTYGSVICATHKASGRCVAIKKVRMASNREGVNMSVLRELKALQALQGPHVVELLDVFTTKSSLVLVFEYMDCRWAELAVVKAAVPHILHLQHEQLHALRKSDSGGSSSCCCAGAATVASVAAGCPRTLFHLQLLTAGKMLSVV